VIAGVQARLPLAGGILERMIAIRSAIMLLTHSLLPTSIAPVPPPINPYTPLLTTSESSIVTGFIRRTLNGVSTLGSTLAGSKRGLTCS
jgi:hypothetical protein